MARKTMTKREADASAAIFCPVHSIRADVFSRFTADAERRPSAVAANDRRPARAIRSSLALEAGNVARTPLARAPGDARRVDFRSRSNSATSRLAALALSALLSSLPLAAALAKCRSPVDTFANPFEKESAHHRPIGSGAVFADRNHPSTISLLKGSFNNINSNNGYGINVFESTAADPLLTVTSTGSGIGLPVKLRVPENANNMQTTDAVIVIHDTTSNTAHEFYFWRWNNGKPTAHLHRQWSSEGLGHSRPGGPRVGMTASGVAGIFGLLRGHEVNTPGYKIEHALQISLSYTANCGSQIQPKIVWPASGMDKYCKRNPGLCKGNIPYGALLALPPSTNISGLGLSEPGKRVASALQNYGVYVVDTTGCPNMRGDQFINAGARQALIKDMRKIYPLLRMVLNNDAGQTASGGGTPRAENCAFDSPDR